ncbi:inositol monophosphatase family protein [Verticiella sediminum]
MDAAVTAAHCAAGVLQSYARNRGQLVIDHKARNDLVSQADREAESAILEVLRERTPEFGIVAEESGGSESGPASWYIDPLDGTTNFLHGLPHYAVSIALVAKAGTVLPPGEVLSEDTPVVAVVYDPSREELFTGVLGGGAWLNGHRVRVSRPAGFADTLLATGFPFRDFSFAEEYMPMFLHAMESTRGVRRFGSAVLDLAWTACGRYDGYWEMGLAPWDVAAGVLLVREAGGVASDLRGSQPWPRGGNVVAGSRMVAGEMLARFAPHLAGG